MEDFDKQFRRATRGIADCWTAIGLAWSALIGFLCWAVIHFTR